MKAVIMAGGDGKRLRPLSCTMPKPMVPLLNKPVLGYCMELIKKHGFDEAILTLRYLPNVIRRYIGDGSAFGIKAECAVEDKPMGTAGGVKNALRQADDSVLIMSGDAMCDFDLTDAMREHRRSGAAATILLKKVKVPMEYGVVLKDKDGFISRFIEKPSAAEVFSDLVNTGIYIIEPSVLDMVPEGTEYDFSKDLFPRMLRTGMKIFGYEAEGYWSDIGDLTQYALTQADMLGGKCIFKTAARRTREGVYIEDGAKISERAVLAAPCYVGSDAEIGAKAYFGANSVACTGARIDERCSVKRSILLPNVRLREGAELRGAILCENVQVGRDSVIYEGAVAGAGSDIGARSIVGEGVKLWPYKRLEAEGEYRENIIWRGDCAACAEEKPEEGYADRELSAEKAARIGAAFASTAKLPAEFAIATDGAQQCVMLKYAVMAGMASQGVDVWDAGVCSRSALGHAIRGYAFDGGIFIAHQEGERHMVSMELMDGFGLGITNETRRKFVNGFREGDRQSVTRSRLGIIQRLNGVSRAYEASLRSKIGHGAVNEDNEACVLIAHDRPLFDAVANVLIRAGIDVRFSEDAEDAKLPALMTRLKAGLCIGRGESGIWAIANDRRLNEDEVQAVLMIAAARSGQRAEVVAADMPQELCTLISTEGVELIKAPRVGHGMEHTAMERGLWQDELFEAEAAAIRLCALKREGKLDEIMALLPEIAKEHGEVKCSWREIGRVLRSLVESGRDEDMELIEGVRIASDDGWVLVRPNKGLKGCSIRAESFREEYAKELCDIYSDKIKAILANADDKA